MRTWSKPQKIITQHNWCKVALDFNCHWLILSHVALTKFNSILFVIQFSNWTQLKIQQHVFNIVERGVREGGKNRLPIFPFVNEHNKKKKCCLSRKGKIFEDIPRVLMFPSTSSWVCQATTTKTEEEWIFPFQIAWLPTTYDATVT